MAVTKQDLLSGFSALGVRSGMVLMVHSSLPAFGEVEGGPETVIDALLEAVGPEGTLALPAFAYVGVFDAAETPTTMGAIAEGFRKRPGVTRSLHPTHSISVLGPRADFLTADHLADPSAIGTGSPWGKLASIPEGHVLLLGVDQDRNTLLHHAEELVAAPYLQTIRAEYRDPVNGTVVVKQLCRFPGPHRDFLGLDRLFLDGGAMRVGKIGSAVCRMMNAARVVELELAALRRDTAAVLCTNQRCIDCVEQRAAILRSRLASEDFTLTAVVDDVSARLEDLPRSLRVLRWQGVRDVEFGPSLARAMLEKHAGARLDVSEALASARMRTHTIAWTVATDDWTAAHVDDLRPVLSLAARLGAHKLILRPTANPATDPAAWRRSAAELLADLQPAAAADDIAVLVENVAGSPLSAGSDCEAFFAEVPPAHASLAFSPAAFVHAGERPFLGVYSHGRLRSRVAQLYISDGARADAPQPRPLTLPGHGQGEVKELVSILRCRSFSGSMTIRARHAWGQSALRDAVAAFWHLRGNL